ncbi:MAG: phosphoenolpyruvate--protein phosphotransferase [Malacoplasma sp.]|nr:phosphoenolpyruvate--protein phosphotransferase [Malacoplasma sp.]
MEIILKGIGASEGIAIAKVFLLKKPNFLISDSKISDIDFEIKRISDSILKATEEINKIKEIAISKIGYDKALVFDAHAQIANDPEVKSRIENLVKENKFNGAYAIETAFNEIHDIFANMDDDYFKQRASDVNDVKERILSTFLNIKLPNLLTIKEEVIIIANDLTPSETALLDKKYVKGFLTNVGGRTSHAALMARTMEIPAVLGLKDITEKVKENEIIAMDGSNGEVVISPSNKNFWLEKINKFEMEKIELKKYVNLKTKTLDNHEVDVVANIGKPDDVSKLENYGSEGVGLVRSEFLYMENNNWPTEEEQFLAYKQILENQKEKLVIVRTLDIGGDKKLKYFEFPPEMNPFLGYRAIRFCLKNENIFKTQIRALLKASVFGKLGIMFPMIATIDEFLKAKAIVEDVKKELDSQKIKFDEKVLVGMMVEIPSTAFMADKFAKYADFFSIGTNDLVQYTFAADRMSENVSYLYQPNNPALLRAIKATIEGASKYNRFVGMCGEMAGDIRSIPILLGLGQKGLDEFSMSASSIPKAKKIICSLKHSDCIELANQAINCETEIEVNKLVETFLQKRNLI